MDPKTEQMIRNDIRLRRSPLWVAVFIFLGAIALPLLLYFGGAIERFLRSDGFLH